MDSKEIKVTVLSGNIAEQEQTEYVKMALAKYGSELSALEIVEINPDEVELHYILSKQPFERVRRITGYLVGTLDRWNNAKQAEERDRVKHDV